MSTISLPLAVFVDMLHQYPQTVGAIFRMGAERRRKPTDDERKAILSEGGDDLWRHLFPPRH